MESCQTLEDLVASHPFLAGFPVQFRGFLCDCASVRRFGWHQQIFREGGEADHFYLILNGKVLLETATPDGGKLIIQTLGPGDALGWSWLFPPHQWRFTATTGMPTEVLSFAAAMLRSKSAEDCGFAAELLSRLARTLVQRLQATRSELIQCYNGNKIHEKAA